MAGEASDVLVDIQGLSKAYGALRPIRMASFAVRRGDLVALTGFDQAAAEMFVTLITGAALPDEGTVHLFGHRTTEITGSEQWFALIEQLGITSDRAVLVEQFTAAQNIAMPFTLELEPIPQHVMAQAVALAREVGLDEQALDGRVGDAPPAVQVRVRLARALALEPSLVLAEHPSASLPREDVASFARTLVTVARARRIGLVAISADKDFIRAFDGTTLMVDPATGQVRKPTLWERFR